MTASAPRLLIIDDDTQILETLSLLLSRTYTVDSAHDGTEGLRLYYEHNPSVIICDLMMPQVSGIDIYHAIKAHRPKDEKKIIFISGGACSNEAHEFLASIENPRIEKPFHTKMIRPLIEKILNGN